ncbi:hypothetical protein FSP39_013496 [Pinctada imbricata]|uniref:Laminin G domain-containing protein n=1 Tax=Pinctada imbricata TaxID=66713 RepID=A0AA88YP65_PINIB|nr:hypothetical protein FSP39_013496 [Pinctada imbricata]
MNTDVNTTSNVDNFEVIDLTQNRVNIGDNLSTQLRLNNSSSSSNAILQIQPESIIEAVSDIGSSIDAPQLMTSSNNDVIQDVSNSGSISNSPSNTESLANAGIDSNPSIEQGSNSKVENTDTVVGALENQAQVTSTSSPAVTTNAVVATTTEFFITTTEMTTTTELTTPGGAQVATDTSGVPCNVSACMTRFRVNPVNPRQYKEATYDGSFNDFWLTCPGNLEWNNETCLCDWPKVRIDPDCKCCKQGLMKHDSNIRLYKQFMNGRWEEKSCTGSSSAMMWDDENCQCKWDKAAQKAKVLDTWKPVPVPQYKCIELLDMPLDKDFKNKAKINHFRPTNQVQPIKAKLFRFKSFKGSKNGGSMAIRNSPLFVPAFRSNGLTSNVYLRFRFKPNRKQRNSYKRMTLFTNGCAGEDTSLELNFITANETLEVILGTKRKTIHVLKKINKDATGWYSVEMYLYDKHLVVNVNNKEIYKSNGLRGAVLSTNCGLTIAGSRDNPRVSWDGFLDEIYMVKQCAYPKLHPDKLMKTTG